MRTESAARVAATNVEVLTTTAEVRAHLEEWWTVLERSRCARPWNAPEWLLAACVALPATRPWVPVLVRDGVPVGYLPWVLQDGVVRFPTRMADSYDAVVAQEEDVFPLVAGALSRVDHPGELLHMPDEALLWPALDACGADSIGLDTARTLADVAPTLEAWIGARGKRTRKSLRRSLRLGGEAGVEARELVDWTPEAVAHAFYAVHTARIGDGSCFHDPGVRGFLQAALPPLLRRGALRAFGVLRGDELLAIDVVGVTPRGLALWNGGFLPGADAVSPGTLNLLAVHAAGIAEGAVELDLGRGFATYKQRFSSRVSPLHARGWARP